MEPAGERGRRLHHVGAAGTASSEHFAERPPSVAAERFAVVRIVELAARREGTWETVMVPEAPRHVAQPRPHELWLGTDCSRIESLESRLDDAVLGSARASGPPVRRRRPCCAGWLLFVHRCQSPRFGPTADLETLGQSMPPILPTRSFAAAGFATSGYRNSPPPMSGL